MGYISMYEWGHSCQNRDAIPTHEDGQDYKRENEMAKDLALIFKGQVEK